MPPAHRPIPNLTAAQIRSFNERVGPADPKTGCTEWLGAKSRGYGNVSFNKGFYRAHRVSFVLAGGEIPEGMVLDHLCRNPTCVRPSHLEPVSQKVNCERGDGGTNHRAKTECPRGHAYDIDRVRPDRGGVERACSECKNEAAREGYWRRKRARGGNG